MQPSFNYSEWDYLGWDSETEENEPDLSIFILLIFFRTTRECKMILRNYLLLIAVPIQIF